MIFDAFAGLLFTEWYWLPLFFVMFLGPWIAAISFISYLVLRRDYKKRQLPFPKFLLLKIIIGSTVLTIVGYYAYSDYQDYNRSNALSTTRIFR